MNILTDLQNAFTQFIGTTYGAQIPPVVCTLNVDEQRQQFGDISTNIALLLSKVAKRKPTDIAQEIAAQFTHPALAKIEVAGPGFLNLHLTQDSFAMLARQLLDQGPAFFKPDQHETPYNTCIEFVSANPTGPLHFGHGRGGI